MTAPTQIQPPENWQDFELLCKKLWGEIWDCTDTIKRNGRSGQNQCGVDVYAAPNSGVEYYGIQCKGKDCYTHAKLTTKEIDEEIEKAKNFKPQLKVFYFATTAVKDVKIEEYIREKNIESIQNGGFSIDVFSWEDIKDLLIERRNTYNWYINNCQYIDCSDVEVEITNNNLEVVTKLHKVTTKYQLHPYRDNESLKQLFDLTKQINRQWRSSSLQPPSKVNYSWCDLFFRITNIGSTALFDYHLIVGIEQTSGVLSCCINYNNNYMLNAVERTYVNNKIDSERELFYSKEYSDALEYRPKNTKLVQGETKSFKARFLPDINKPSVKIIWFFLSNGYKKTGKIEINVKHEIEDFENIIYVDTEQELKPDEVSVNHKIIEQ